MMNRYSVKKTYTVWIEVAAESVEEATIEVEQMSLTTLLAEWNENPWFLDSTEVGPTIKLEY